MSLEPLTYEIQDLESARKFLHSYKDPVIITNPYNSTKYYGMLVLDYMFKNLQAEFPQIIKIIVNVDDDLAALFTALKLNYENINYNGSSKAAKELLLKKQII